MNLLIGTLTHTFEQLCIIILPGLILTFGMNHISGRLEASASRIIGPRLYMLLFGWLGTSVHELSHALMCILFRHRINKIQLFNLDPKSSYAGYVSHSFNPNSLYQKIGRLFIGVAPIILGSMVIYFSAKLLLPGIIPQIHVSTASLMDLPFLFWDSLAALTSILFNFENYSNIGFYLFLYIMFCVGSSVKLSKADLSGAWAGFVTFVSILLLLNIGFNYASACGDDIFSDITIVISRRSFFIYNIMTIVLLLTTLFLGAIYFLNKYKR